MGDTEKTAPEEEKKPEPEKKEPVEQPSHDEATAAEKPEPKGVAAIVEAVKGEAAKPDQAGTGEVKAEPPKPGLFFPDIRKVQEKKSAGTGPKPDLHPPARPEIARQEPSAETPEETVEEPEPKDVQRPPPKAPADAKQAPPQPSSKKRKAKPVDIGGDYIVGGLFITSKPKEVSSYAFTVGHLNEHDKDIILFMGRYLQGMGYIPENNPLFVAKFALNFLFNGIKEELGLKAGKE